MRIVVAGCTIENLLPCQLDCEIWPCILAIPPGSSPPWGETGWKSCPWHSGSQSGGNMPEVHACQVCPWSVLVAPGPWTPLRARWSNTILEGQWSLTLGQVGGRSLAALCPGGLPQRPAKVKACMLTVCCPVVVLHCAAAVCVFSLSA